MPTSLSICVLWAWCPFRMEPIKCYLFFIELWKQGHQMYQCIGGVYYNVWIFVYMSVYAILYIPCPYFKIIYWYLITLLFWHVWVYLIWQPLFELIVVLTMDLYDFAGSCVNWVIKWTIAYHIDPWPGNKRRHKQSPIWFIQPFTMCVQEHHKACTVMVHAMYT